MITQEKKQAAITAVRTHDTDTGSAPTQIAVATERIKELTEHLKLHNKDFAARRGLLQLVGRRRQLLRYVAAHDSNAYLDLIQKLGIRR